MANGRSNPQEPAAKPALSAKANVPAAPAAAKSTKPAAPAADTATVALVDDKTNATSTAPAKAEATTVAMGS